MITTEKKIIQSETEPNINDLWYKDGQVKAFKDNEWESIKIDSLPEDVLPKDIFICPTEIGGTSITKSNGEVIQRQSIIDLDTFPSIYNTEEVRKHKIVFVPYIHVDGCNCIYVRVRGEEQYYFDKITAVYIKDEDGNFNFCDVLGIKANNVVCMTVSNLSSYDYSTFSDSADHNNIKVYGGQGQYFALYKSNKIFTPSDKYDDSNRMYILDFGNSSKDINFTIMDESTNAPTEFIIKDPPENFFIYGYYTSPRNTANFYYNKYNPNEILQLPKVEGLLKVNIYGKNHFVTNKDKRTGTLECSYITLSGIVRPGTYLEPNRKNLYSEICYSIPEGHNEYIICIPKRSNTSKYYSYKIYVDAAGIVDLSNAVSQYSSINTNLTLDINIQTGGRSPMYITNPINGGRKDTLTITGNIVENTELMNQIKSEFDASEWTIEESSDKVKFTPKS